MIRSIVGTSLRFRLLVLAAAALTMAIGISQLRGAAVDVLPEFTPPYVEVQTEALGLSAEEVEQLITVPMEADLLNGVASVAIWGFRDRQLQVQVDPERLAENGVTLKQIVETTANAQISSPLSFVEGSTPGTGGFLETPPQRLRVRHVFDRLTNPDELGKVPVE